MAKRTTVTARTTPATTRTPAPTAKTTDAMEDRVIAFAEQLGRMAGTVQARAKGWMDRDTLSTQVASVRDSAATLLQHLTGSGVAETAAPPARPTRTTARSGGIVDAPGKTHRKRAPADPDARAAKAQADKVRTARTMVKTKRLRGRG